MSKYLYRIVDQTDWEIAQREGVVPRCGADDRDGFVHLSTENDYLETANRYFVPAERPLALVVDEAALGGTLRWEVVTRRGGVRFPHLYAAGIPLQSVRGIIRLDHGDNGFVAQAMIPFCAR